MQDNSEVRTDILANLTDPHIRSPAHFVTFLLIHFLFFSSFSFSLPSFSSSTSLPPLALLALSAQIRSCPLLGNQISPPPCQCQPSCFILHKMAHIQQSRPTRLYVTFIWIFVMIFNFTIQITEAFQAPAQKPFASQKNSNFSDQTD